jgi:hypothetical protein
MVRGLTTPPTAATAEQYACQLDEQKTINQPAFKFVLLNKTKILFHDLWILPDKVWVQLGRNP